MLLGTQALTVRYCFDNFLLRHYIHFWPKSRKMSNLRAPAKNIISLLHKSHYSSSNEKVGQELLKQVLDVGQNKANSDKLVNLLPYLQHKNTEYISRTNSSETQPEEKRESDPVELVKQGDHLKPLSVESTSDEATPSHNVSESSKVPAQGSVIPEALHEPPQSLPVLMLGQIKTPTVDLTNATLPLSLHMKEKKGFFVDAVVQDIKHVYSKTSSSIDSWYLIARSQGKTFYLSAEEFIKRPGLLQDFLREKANNNAVAIYNPKLSALANFDIGSVTKKLEEMIKGLIAMIQKIFASITEKKKSLEDKKDDKKDHKPEKVDTKKSQEDKNAPKTQDFYYVYNKTRPSVGVCCLPEYERGITLNMIAETIKQSIIKGFLQKSDLCVVQCSKKTPIGPVDPLRILDDLRGILKNIFDRTDKEKKLLHELKKEEKELKKIEEKLENLYKEHEGGKDKNKIKEDDKKK